MKILHLALQAPYNEGWGYQENLLPKYQAKMGHEVVLVTTCLENSGNSEYKVCSPTDYISPDNFRVIRIERKKSFFQRIRKILCLYDIYHILKEVNPDFIMVHGLGSFSCLQVKRFVKRIKPDCVVIADNHLDYNNNAVLSKGGAVNRLIKFLWKRLNRRMRCCYSKVYGVSPLRTKIANTEFGYPLHMLDTLHAGADDDKINFTQRNDIRSEIRSNYGISEDDFLIVTGGKIDEKKNIDMVMNAVAEIDKDNVKLLVFGNCTESIKKTIEKLAEHRSVCYIGWIDSDKTYDYFLAADLVMFPGLHSVMWEQACASKTPCVFRRLDGFEHFDIGGNCVFFDDVSVEGIVKEIEDLVFTEKYRKMKQVCESNKTDIFLYSNIAVKSLEQAKTR